MLIAFIFICIFLTKLINYCIVFNLQTKQYIFNFPIHCSFVKEEDYYLIKNELIDITATGLTSDEVEQNFNEEFDYLYTRLNELDNSKLSIRLQNIKLAINLFIKEVNCWF